MRRLRWWLPLGMLAAVAVLVAWFPARWAWAWLAPHYPDLRLQDVGGSVWHGHAGEVTMLGRPLGTFDWTLGRAALLGRWHGDFALHGAVVDARGHWRRSGPGLVSGRGLHVSLPATQLPPAWFRGLRPGGTLSLDLDTFELDHGWPVKLHGTSAWADATLAADGRRAALGTLYADWRQGATSVIRATPRAEPGGPVAVTGGFVATPLGWRLDLDVIPHRDDPSLRSLLLRLGTPTSGGGVRVRRHGGLFSGDAP